MSTVVVDAAFALKDGDRRPGLDDAALLGDEDASVRRVGDGRRVGETGDDRLVDEARRQRGSDRGGRGGGQREGDGDGDEQALGDERGGGEDAESPSDDATRSPRLVAWPRLQRRERSP